MKIQPILSLILCAALVSPSAAQVRVSAGISRGPVGISMVPSLGGMSSPVTPSLNGAVFLSPSLSLSAAPAPSLDAVAAPIPALSAAAIQPLVPAAAANTVVPKAVAPLALNGMKPLAQPRNESPSVSAVEIRSQSESFWSGAASKESLDDSVPVVVPAAKTPSTLARGAAALAPASVAALPSLPAWASAAVPYVEGAAVLGVAYGLTRFSRFVINKLASRFGWEPNTVVLARFISSVVVWTSGVGVGLSVLGVSGTALLATFGAGGTAMALAVTLAVRDVAGNLFHGVHFLLSRPFTIGDKVTIGKTTGVVHDLTLRYLVLRDDNEGFILFTYNKISSAAVTLYGEYQTKEIRLKLRKPALPQGLLRALRDAASPTLWKPILFSVLAIAALSFFPLLPVVLKGTSASWLAAVLPYVKAGVVAFLTASVSRSIKNALERLASRYGWPRPVATVIKLGAGLLAWIIGGSFLLNAAGVSWTWVAGTLSLSTVLVSIAVNDYVSSVFQGSLVLALKPFKVGDLVKIGEHEGTVVDINLKYVVLKLDADSFMLIPHSVVKDSAIATPREYGQRRK
ncbi:MAG: mechanosensitive ion channel [Elusimicrobiota bacterium]|nr:mechanosensitive ion channel [Elusimicrobiota bacterium]